MISAAAGLAQGGVTPLATTYAVLASRRAGDSICMAIVAENPPVKIVCALPGLTTGYGPSHQATGDLAIMRAMPNLTVVAPCEAAEIDQATRAIAAHPGPVYMRLLRGNVPDVLFASAAFMTMRVLDVETIVVQAGKGGRLVVTAENHSPYRLHFWTWARCPRCTINTVFRWWR